MAPQIVRLERAAVCACGELVSAGERAGYAAPPDMVVCLSCLADQASAAAHAANADGAHGGDGAHHGVQPAADGGLPTRWTADAAVIATTLEALRGRTAVLPAREASPGDFPEGSSGSSPEPSADHLPEPSADHLPEPAADHPPEPAVMPPDGARTASGSPAGSPETAVDPALPRRSRRDVMEEQQMPAAAHRRRAGLFARLLTVRSFRGQRRQAAGPSRADHVVDSLLEAATAQGVLTLHHRRVPGRRGRVEHIAVGASGVYVIDVRHGGNASVEVHRVGDAPADDTLVVGGRDLTPAVVATAGRVAALRALLADVGLDDVPVNGALCVVEGLMPPSRDSLEVAGVHVVQPGDLAAQVTAPGAFSADDRETLRELLARELPPSA